MEVEVTRSALAEPVAPVRNRWIAAWSAGLFGWYMAYFAGAQILLPKQAEQIAGNDKITLLAVVTGVAAVVTIVVNIAVGALSDRTLSRRGRRQPWVLGGAILTGFAVAGQGLQTTVAGMVLVWAIAQVGMSSTNAALMAAVPDEVPVGQRAWVSAFFGLAQAVGPLVGVALVAVVILDLAPGYALLGLLALLLALPYSLGTRGVPLDPADRPPRLSPRRIVKGTIAPLRHHDFAWAWSGRFFIQLSNALAQVYLFYYLQDYVHYPDPEGGTLVLIVVYTVGVVIAAPVCGRFSDRTGRRKRLVVVSSVLQGAAGLLLAFLPTFGTSIVAAGILGLGYGAYAAVDQALVTQVLPHAEDRGKDLGVINVANNLPYVLTPVIGAPVIAVLGGYRTLMVLVLVTAVIAALTVQPIRSVR
jgi:MFS family permease